MPRSNSALRLWTAVFAVAAANPAMATLGGATDYKLALADARFSAGGTSLYDPITFDAVAASVNRTAVEIALSSDKGLVAVGYYLMHVDPFAALHLRAENPFDTEAAFRFNLSIPTTRMVDDQWRAQARFSALLTDGNGDGARASPDVMVFDPANPFARPQPRFMDTAVNLVVGVISYFGGPPVDALGAAALVAPAGGHKSFEQHASADALPSHAFIGPDVAWNTLYLTVAFKLSPHDRIELDARIDVTEIRPVPEPATWALWLLGTGGLLACRRRGSAPSLRR